MRLCRWCMTRMRQQQHNLKDAQNDFTADFTQLVTNSYAIGGVKRNDHELECGDGEPE